MSAPTHEPAPSLAAVGPVGGDWPEADRPVRLLIVAGEASGDRHGESLVRHLRTLVPEGRLEVRAVGGPCLQRSGAHLLYNLVDHATMWIADVIKLFPIFWDIFLRTRRHFSVWRPDAVVCIDYPGFNLRVAKAAKRRGIPVCYYVSPQIWAWFPHRIHRIARAVDRMLVLFPFEKPLYEKIGVDVHYVGHPMSDYLRAEKDDPRVVAAIDENDDEWLVGLMPGSRTKEVRPLLPTMLEAAGELAHAVDHPIRFLVPVAKAKLADFVRQSVEEAAERSRRQGREPIRVTILDGGANEVMRYARFALVCSGTATLECLFHRLPIVVLYQVNRFIEWLARLFLTVENVSLVNILAGRLVVPEYVFDRPSIARIVELARPLVEEGQARRHILAELDEVRARVDQPGASERAAFAVLDFVRQERGRRRSRRTSGNAS